MVKERISLTLDKVLIDSVDSLVDGVKFRSRSHVMEFLLNKGLGKGNLRKAYILAGGKGIKMRPMMPKGMRKNSMRITMATVWELELD